MWEYTAIGGEEYVVCPPFLLLLLSVVEHGVVWESVEGRGKEKDNGGCYLGVYVCVCVCVCVYNLTAGQTRTNGLRMNVGACQGTSTSP